MFQPLLLLGKNCKQLYWDLCCVTKLTYMKSRVIFAPVWSLVWLSLENTFIQTPNIQTICKSVLSLVSWDHHHTPVPQQLCYSIPCKKNICILTHILVIGERERANLVVWTGYYLYIYVTRTVHTVMSNFVCTKYRNVIRIFTAVHAKTLNPQISSLLIVAHTRAKMMSADSEVQGNCTYGNCRSEKKPQTINMSMFDWCCSPLSDLSSSNRRLLMSPTSTKPLILNKCLSYTKSSLTFTSSKMQHTHFWNSGIVARLAISMRCSSTFDMKPVRDSIQCVWSLKFLSEGRTRTPDSRRAL